MNILLLPFSYPPILGGLQTVVHSLAREWEAGGHKVHVVTNRYPRQLLAEEILDGIRVRRMLFLYPDWHLVSRKRLDLFSASLFYYPFVTRKLAKLIQEFKPDIVNVHFPDEQVAHILKLQKKMHFKLVVSLHGHDIQRWDNNPTQIDASYNPSSKLRVVRLLQNADFVTSCSQHLLEQAAALEPTILKKGLAIHNGVDLKRFEEKKCHLHPRSYLFACGRLTYKKGFDLLIDAYQKISSKQLELDLILAGVGEERSNLEKQVKKHQLEERIYLFGQASQKQVVHLLNGCQVAVIPSRQEPFGIAALEAMAAGKPVLATRVGGIPEFLPEEGNWLVEPDVDNIANGLSRMLEEYRGNIEVRSNRERAADFSWRASAEKFIDVFLNIKV